MSDEQIITVDCTVATMATIARAAAAACQMTPEAFALWAAVNRAEAVIDPLRTAS